MSLVTTSISSLISVATLLIALHIAGFLIAAPSPITYKYYPRIVGNMICPWPISHASLDLPRDSRTGKSQDSKRRGLAPEAVSRADEPTQPRNAYSLKVWISWGSSFGQLVVWILPILSSQPLDSLEVTYQVTSST